MVGCGAAAPVEQGASSSADHVCEPIFHSGTLGGVGRRRLMSEAQVGAGYGAGDDPSVSSRTGVGQSEEEGLVQELVPHRRVERLANASPRRGLPGAMKCRLTVTSSLLDSMAFEVNSVCCESLLGPMA